MKQARHTARHTDLAVEAAVSVPQVVEYLEQLVAALKAGAVHVHVGAQELVLGPRGVLGLKLRARQKGKRQKLALELTWRKRLALPETGFGLEIRAAPPESAPESIEVVDLAETDGGAGQEQSDTTAAGTATAARGEAHEGELTTSSPDDGTSA